MTKASSRAATQKSRTRLSSSDRWGILILGGGAVATVLLIVVLLSPRAVNTAGLEGLVTYSNLSRDHSELEQQYAQTPPAGGVHSAAWQNCGFYDQPVRNELAVHSLEHGAVWLTYRPDLPAAAIETLRGLARGHSHVLVSPYPDLPSPVVATAWEVQLPVDDATDPRLATFVLRYEQGPQTPEPGAICTGGTGTPLAN